MCNSINCPHTNDDMNDDLDDIFGAPTARAPRAPANPELVAVIEKQHLESCAKCGGSGRFRSWSGRDCGPCHACKGRGQRAFKNSAADRAKARHAAQDRLHARQKAGVEGFAAENPDVYAWFVAKAPTFDFARSLLDAMLKYGALTDRQLAAAVSCMAKDKARAEQAVARVQNAVVVDMSKINAAFASAHKAIKSPSLRVAGMILSPAKAHSNNPGAIYVKTSGHTYLGKITPEHKFVRSRECTDELEAQLLAVAADPLAAAVAYGRKTGECSCCGRELTNALSIELGIGPICRARYGW